MCHLASGADRLEIFLQVFSAIASRKHLIIVTGLSEFFLRPVLIFVCNDILIMIKYDEIFGMV